MCVCILCYLMCVCILCYLMCVCIFLCVWKNVCLRWFNRVQRVEEIDVKCQQFLTISWLALIWEVGGGGRFGPPLVSQKIRHIMYKVFLRMFLEKLFESDSMEQDMKPKGKGQRSNGFLIIIMVKLKLKNCQLLLDLNTYTYVV